VPSQPNRMSPDMQWVSQFNQLPENGRPAGAANR
jgi:hypothetical protein